MISDDLRAECPCKEFDFEKCPECPKSTNLSDDHAACIREDMVPPGADHTNSPAVCACCSTVIEERASSKCNVCEEDDQQSADLNEECPYFPGGICSLFIQCMRIICEEDFVDSCDVYCGPSPSSFNMDYWAVCHIGKCIHWGGTHQQLEEILRKFHYVCWHVSFALSLLKSLVILDHKNT